MSANRLKNICKELIAYYNEEANLYPSLRSLLKIQPSFTNRSPSIKKQTALKISDDRSISLTPEQHKNNPLPISFSPKELTSSPKEFTSKNNSTKSSWHLQATYHNTSNTEIIKEKYPSMNKVFQPPFIVPCCIINTEENAEILFTNRLAKIITKQLFPTRVLPSNQIDLMQLTSSFHLVLCPLPLIQKSIPDASYHQILTKNDKLFIGLYSYKDYDQELQLKRDLWNLLNQVPIQYTLK